MRDYGIKGQLGLESKFETYIAKLCTIYDEVKRVLRDDGTCWVNLGDTYANTGYGKGTGNFQHKDKEGAMTPKSRCELPTKSLCLIPQRFAIEMVNRGWILRNCIIWAKPNPMPSSAKDRFTVDFEYVYFFVKSKKYWFEPLYEPYDYDGRHKTTLEPTRKYANRNYSFDNPQQMARGPMERWPCPLGRNKRTVWTIPTQAYPDAHFATFPEKLVEPMILSGCPKEVCSKCGQGRRKVYEDIGEKTWKDNRQNQSADSVNVGTRGLSFGRSSQMLFKGYTDCGCGEKFRPGIVLDPFVGRARLVRSLPRTDETGLVLNSSRSISRWRCAA